MLNFEEKGLDECIYILLYLTVAHSPRILCHTFY